MRNYIICGGQICNGACDFDEAVMGACAEVQAVHGHAQEVPGVGDYWTKLADLVRTQTGIDADFAVVAEARALDFSRPYDALADGGAGLGTFGAAEIVKGDRGRLDVEAYAIQ